MDMAFLDILGLIFPITSIWMIKNKSYQQIIHQSLLFHHKLIMKSKKKTTEFQYTFNKT